MGIRMVMWRNSGDIVRERPLAGYGMGGIAPAYERAVKASALTGWAATPTEDPHNQYLQVQLEAGVAGSAFTMIGSTGPTAGQLYIVDTFLVVVFGGASSLLGTIASAFTISQAQSSIEFFLSGSMAKVLTLLTVVGILMLRPQGLFTLKVRR